MRIATWNINGVRARLDFVKLWLAERKPDLVGFQELKATEDQFPWDELAELGYEAVVHGQKAWNGVAILSRVPFEARTLGLPDRDEDGARLVTVATQGLDFTTVYCPNGKSLQHPDFPKKLAWFDTLVAHLDEAMDAGRETVVCGDFNVVPAPIDSWNEEFLGGGIFHTVAERERIGKLHQLGLVDLWRYRSDDPGYTWWDYRGGAFHKNRGLRIDLILATPGIANRCRYAQVDRDWRKKVDGLTPSDHCPVWADLED